MPDAIFRELMQSLGATAADLVLLIMVLVMGTASFYAHISLRREIKADLNRVLEDSKDRTGKLWEQVNLLKERYHRLDALSLALAKVVQLARTGKAKLVKESANGDGDYTLDREY